MKNDKKILNFKVIVLFIAFFSALILIVLLSFLIRGFFFDNFTNINNLPVTGNEEKYYVFVTSLKYKGDFAFRGNPFQTADKICKDIAKNKKINETSYWTGFISFNYNGKYYSAYEQVPIGKKYYNLNNEQVMDDISNIEGCISNSCLSSKILDENKQELNGYVWTGIKKDLVPINNCSNWTSSLTENVSVVGIANSKNSTWAVSEILMNCSLDLSIYCFEAAKDKDGDGKYESMGTVNPKREVEIDCNDFDKEIYPGKSEVCNGKDDNCNIQIDEGFGIGDACTVGVGACQSSGTKTCSGCNAIEKTPAVEICNNVDDDCDGQIDEGIEESCGQNEGICTVGVRKCINGNWGDCSGVKPQIEICDGLDNDCDGTIDENCSCQNGQTQLCGVSVGACSVGTQWCQNGKWGNCIGAKGPKKEICDGIDNDCDGQVDENLSISCGSTIGICKEGNSKCIYGKWSDCEDAVNPVDEICDGLDNNCDGTVDEGCGCQEGVERVCGIELGECKKGIQKCSNGLWNDCVGAIKPSEEICDYKDNDCDGLTDEEFVCDEQQSKKDIDLEKKIEKKEDEIKELKKNLFDKISIYKIYIIIAFLSITAIPSLAFFISRIIKSRNKKRFETFRNLSSENNLDSKKSPLAQ